MRDKFASCELNLYLCGVKRKGVCNVTCSLYNTPLQFAETKMPTTTFNIRVGGG